MAISPERALSTAVAYVASDRVGCRVESLMEDATDYFAVLVLDDPDGDWPLGPGPVFVSKQTGEVWSDAYGTVLEKIDAMRPIT